MESGCQCGCKMMQLIQKWLSLEKPVIVACFARQYRLGVRVRVRFKVRVRVCIYVY